MLLAARCSVPAMMVRCVVVSSTAMVGGVDVDCKQEHIIDQLKAKILNKLSATYLSATKLLTLKMHCYIFVQQHLVVRLDKLPKHCGLNPRVTNYCFFGQKMVPEQDSSKLGQQFCFQFSQQPFQMEALKLICGDLSRSLSVN
ncbi:unnamed protein product [Litomosoides sigmodontis]|uniref:Uncharacterized protein n=1 Tax=Litomosoides sigmodontis TaxID=42156 RepID=A0A3P6UHP3_LITSI|nr:unnamed protein product [Litomosoides sigmodontis]